MMLAFSFRLVHEESETFFLGLKTPKLLQSTTQRAAQRFDWSPEKLLLIKFQLLAPIEYVFDQLQTCAFVAAGMLGCWSVS